jgi:hypothetical protein
MDQATACAETRRARRRNPIPGWSLGKRKGLAALASANPSSFLVAGAGFAEYYTHSEILRIDLVP